MKNEESNNRNEKIDLLRGVLIILVVLNHVIQYVYAPENYDNVLLFRVIQSFHMPLFMCVSGYVMQMGKHNMKWALKRWISLIIPFLSWNIITSIYKHDATILWKTIINPNSGLWFLYALAFITVFIYVSELLSEKIGDISYVVVNVLLLLIPFSIFGTSLIKLYYTWVAIGYVVPRYWKKLNIRLKTVLKITGLIGWPITAFFWMRTGAPLFLDMSDYSGKLHVFISIFSLIYRCYLVPALGIIFVCSLWSRIWKVLNCKMLKYIGCHTTEIYAMQWYFWIVFFNTAVLNSIVSFILGIYGPLLIGYIIRKNKYTAFVFLGKWPVNKSYLK